MLRAQGWDRTGKRYTGSIFAGFIHLFDEMLGRTIDEVWLGEDGAPLVEATREEVSYINALGLNHLLICVKA